MAIVTAETGLTSQEIEQELRDGAILADLITETGGDVDNVIAQGVEMVTAQVNQALEDSTITQEQADEILADLEEEITEILYNPIPDSVLDNRQDEEQESEESR